LEYICESYGENQFWGQTPQDRATVSKWLFWEQTHWQAEFAKIITGHVGHYLRPDVVTEPEMEPNWEADAIRQSLVTLDKQLSENKYATGEQISIADVALVGMAMFFTSVKFPFQLYPNIERWFYQVKDTEAWRKNMVYPWV
jgi:glutathione S-transferase